MFENPQGSFSECKKTFLLKSQKEIKTLTLVFLKGFIQNWEPEYNTVELPVCCGNII